MVSTSTLVMLCITSLIGDANNTNAERNTKIRPVACISVELLFNIRSDLTYFISKLWNNYQIWKLK